MCSEHSRSCKKNLRATCSGLLGPSLNYTEIDLEKSKFTASDILKQLFDDDSEFSGSDSDGEEGEDVYAYRGPTLSASTLREEETLENIFQVSVFIVKVLYIYC